MYPSEATTRAKKLTTYRRILQLEIFFRHLADRPTSIFPGVVPPHVLEPLNFDEKGPWTILAHLFTATQEDSGFPRCAGHLWIDFISRHDDAKWVVFALRYPQQCHS
jgi:hypothetical protein